MSLALFDLDKTLINGDSDFLWGEFLVEVGAVDKTDYQSKNQDFFDDYAKGKLDIKKYLEFCLQPLSKYNIKQLHTWRDEFIIRKIKPIITKKALSVVKKHQDRGDTLVVITATNQFVVENIVKLFDIPNLIATNAEFKDGKYTGKSNGVPCFREGKITNLNLWLENNSYNLKDSYFYSDSFNDLSLLKLVDNPIVINADNKLLEFAKENNWKIDNWIV